MKRQPDSARDSARATLVCVLYGAGLAVFAVLMFCTFARL